MSAVLGEERSAAQTTGGPAAPPAVSVKHLSKSFRLPHDHYNTLKERALHPFRPRNFDILRAVQDVTIDIGAGEFFGIVGRNGSGKSTLLKCLAGIYQVDDGELEINGRLSPFIELGVGFNPDLTARDNVIINAIMLGLTRKQATERFDDIIAFAELEEFVDLKLKNFSSGMHVRLAFATAVQVDADILLIDEVLAVGDAAFQQKCFDEFMRLQRAGRTILFVTHDMGSVERFCDRAMLLDGGRIVDIGEPVDIARRYNRLNFSRVRAERADLGSAEVPPSTTPPAEILNAWFETPDGDIAVVSTQGELCTVRMDVRFHDALEDPIFSVALHNETSQNVFSTDTVSQRIETGRFEPGSTAQVRMSFQNQLAPGRYRLFAAIARPGLGADVIDAHITSSVVVLADRAGGGLTDLNHTFEVARG